METMTIAQVVKASKKHKYIGLRAYNGQIIGVNSRVMNQALSRTKRHVNSKSIFQGYIPLNINEYINIKVPFIKVNA